MPDPSGNLTPEEKLKIALGLHPTQQPNPLAGGVPQNEASNAPPTLGGGGGQPAPVSPMSAPAAPTKPVVAAPVQPAATALNVPKIGAQRQADETELQRLNSTGSGVSQLAQRHPILGTMARVGSAIGSAMFPSIASAIPGTELHHSALVNRAQGNVNQDIKGEEANAGMAKDAAQTNEATARAEALKNPPPKPEKLDDPKAATFQSLVDGGMKPIEAFQKVMETEQEAKPEKTPTPAHVTYDQGIPVSVADGKGQVYDINDPKLPPELKPLVDSANRAHKQHTTESADSQARAFAQAEHMHDVKQDDLTANSKTMVQSAPIVKQLAGRVRQLVDQQAGSLGPGGSRWQEFWAGKVGSPNPEFTKLRTDVGLLTTKLMQMHVGSRGGEMIMEHFKNLIDAGHQSPENMKAALDEIVAYADQVAQEAPHHGGQPQGGAAATHRFNPATGKIEPIQ